MPYSRTDLLLTVLVCVCVCDSFAQEMCCAHKVDVYAGEAACVLFYRSPRLQAVLLTQMTRMMSAPAERSCLPPQQRIRGPRSACLLGTCPFL